MQNYRDFRNNFVAGVLAPEYLQRTGGELTQTGLQAGTNCFITQAGTVMRRPGSFRLADITHRGRLIIFDLLDGSFRFMIMRLGFLDIYRQDGSLEASLDAPWTNESIPAITVVNDEDRLIFVHDTFFPLNLKFTLAVGSWALDDFVWRTDAASNRVYAPFHRFESDGSTVSISAYTGIATATFSNGFLTAAHVGIYFLYGFGAQFRVTAVQDATTATVELVDRIYPTVVLGMAATNSFRQGDVVTTDVTQIRGIVSSLTASTVTVALTSGYTVPDPATNDILIGPGGSEAITSVNEAAAPAPTPVWFEQLISPVRGYPYTGAIHRNRLCFGGFPQAPNLFTASAANTIDDFNVGSANDADAIITRIGGDPNMRIKSMSSMEQLFINTDRGTFYVDEGGNRLFTPALINFNYINPSIIGDIPAVVTSDGVVFIDNKNRIMLASMTGTTRAAWSVQDISRLGYHLIKDPIQIGYSTGIDGRPERALIVTNGDGTAAVFNYDRQSEQAGWVPWQRGAFGQYRSFASWRGELYVLAQDTTNSAISNYSGERLERVSFNAVIDCQWNTGAFVGENCHLLKGQHVLGTTNSVFNVPDSDAYGFDFAVSISPAPLVIGQAGRQRRRAGTIFIDVIDSGTYRCEGEIMTGYGFEPTVSAVAPVADREDRCHQLGSSYDNVITLSQNEGEGGPLHVRSITMRMKAR